MKILCILLGEPAKDIVDTTCTVSGMAPEGLRSLHIARNGESMKRPLGILKR